MQGVSIIHDVLSDYIVWNASTLGRGNGLFETVLQVIAAADCPKYIVQLFRRELQIALLMGAIPGEGFLCLLFGLLAKLSLFAPSKIGAS